MKMYALIGILLVLNLKLAAQQAYAPSARSYTGSGQNMLAYPQNINDPEDKDLSVLAGILSKLIQQEFNHGDTVVNIERVKGSYIPGSGVLFTIAQRNPFYSRPMLLGANGRYGWGSFGGTLAPGQVIGVAEIDGATIVRTRPGSTPNPRTAPNARNNVGSTSGAAASSPNVVTLLGDSVNVAYSNGLTHAYFDGLNVVQGYPNSKVAKLQDSVFAVKIPRMKKVLERFLSEYTILLSKLKPEEKIWVTWCIKDDHWGINPGKMACELSSRILKQDMLDLRAGKLDQAKFLERVQYSITRCAERVSNPEVEVFTAILERLYSPGVSQNLVQFGAIQAEAIGGFGYIFKMNFSPARMYDLTVARPDALAGAYTLQSGIKELSKEELDQRIKTFKVEFPQQILEYSRVLKGLQSGEILKVDVTLGEYSGAWDMRTEGSKRVSYSLPQSLIRDYDTGKLKLEDAVKLIQVEEK